MKFKKFFDKYVPIDLILKVPKTNLVSKNKLSSLVYIPWNDKFLVHVPRKYLEFFKFVLKHLHYRTTDVHTCLSLSFLPYFLSKYSKLNKKVIIIALILHDVGWSKCTEHEIALSLGVKGLKLTKGAIGPKEKHAREGRWLANKILKEYAFQPPLKKKEIKLVLDIVEYHDKVSEVADQTFPIEAKVVADLDHLWSFTKENFWQDTIRKGVKPEAYLNNLAKDLDEYFITETGEKIARKLLKQRELEVSKLLQVLGK